MTTTGVIIGILCGIILPAHYMLVSDTDKKETLGAYLLSVAVFEFFVILSMLARHFS